MSVTSDSSAYDLLGDPLSSVTRSTKRNLYVFTTLCILIVYTGVIPDETSVLGFKFPGLTESVINWGLFFLGSFNFISFSVHLWSDYFRYRHKRDLYDKSVANENFNAITTDPDQATEKNHDMNEFKSMTGYTDYKIPKRLTKLLAQFKIFLDFIFPLLFGLTGLTTFAILRLG